ncbi:MAG: ATP-dependent helicase C-terminal domain-containing protein, partial [Planctomycetaceae bacterium]
RGETPFGEVNRAASRTIAAAAKQLSRVLKEARGGMPIRSSAAVAEAAGDESLLRALVAGFPDRVARRRDAGGDKALMVGGRGVRLGARSAVRQAPLFLCVDIDGAGSDAEVRQASEVLRSWLPASGLRDSDELFFHPSQKQVVARRRLCFADLVLEETPASIQDSVAAAECLFAAAVGQWAQVLPSEEDAFHSFVQRMRCLKVWMPELPLPDCGDELLKDLLQELCYGRRSFSELKAAPWLSTLQGRLEYSLVQTIEREAPEKLLVPSGSRIRLEYAEGRPPVLAVRIQEIFGLTATPRIAGGRISVLLHLLAPNYRPQQITDDLASFWASTYG